MRDCAGRQPTPSFASLRQVGIVGVPPREVIRGLNRAGAAIQDLDALLVRADLEEASDFMPRVYCAILRTVVVNALHLDLDAIFVDVGAGKCDSAFHVAAVLEECQAAPVVRTVNRDAEGTGFPVSMSGLPLLAKLLAITEGVKTADPGGGLIPPCQPVAGFWGVPPRDFSILEVFPDATHVFGWTRCMENKTPADHALEASFDPAVPTVFYAQSFCAKTALAQQLARRHPHALYLDADATAGGSAKAKIEAFLELSGCFHEAR